MERHGGRLREGGLWARVASAVDRKSLRSASLFNQTSCTALGFLRDSVHGTGAAQAVTGSLLGVVEIESLESTGFEGEKGECRWRRARVDVEIGRC